MKNDFNRIIIENAIRLNLRNFDLDDKRCIRKLIDTGIHLASKNDEYGIFESLGELFKDESSNYYPALSKLMKNSDKEKYIQFGINLGYNTFNKAATTIQQKSRQYNRNIPWIADMDVTTANESGFSTATFSKLINHYDSLGINAYIIRFDADASESAYINILAVIRQNQYTNFLLMLPDKDISPAITERMATLSNILVCLPLNGSFTDKNRAVLAENKILSAMRFTVDSNYSEEILSNTASDNASQSILARVAGYEYPIIIFETDPSMSADEVKHFNSGIPALRSSLPEPVFIINLTYDIQNINKMTSGKEISTHITVKPAAE